MMQVKTIQKNIKLKLESWLASIEDEELRKRTKESLLLSGGSVTSMFLGEEVNDYDIYLQDQGVAKDLAIYYSKGISGIIVWDGRDREKLIQDYWGDGRVWDGKERALCTFENSQAKQAVALRNLKPNQVKIYIDGESAGHKVKSTTIEDANKAESEKKRFKPLYFSPNAISLEDNIQIVIRFSGTPEEIHKTFDFIHATNYFTFKEGLVTNQEALLSIMSKQLRYQGSLYPLTSVIRAKKFVKRDWNIGAGEHLKMMLQIGDLDLQDIDTLEEQLIGVDVAYFDQVIKEIRAMVQTDSDFKLDTGMLSKIIDRVFNEEQGEDLPF